MQEALVAAGWSYPTLESIHRVLRLESDIYRAPSIWLCMIDQGPHLQIDAATGALLYMDAFCFKDELNWPALPYQGADYSLPERPPVTAAAAKSIVDSIAAAQYSAYAGRVFERVRTRPLGKWPVWHVEYGEMISPGDRRYVNELSALVDWTTGRVLEFHATNIHAPYELRISEAAATEIALKEWGKLHERHHRGGSHSETRSRLDVYSGTHGAEPMWYISVDSNCIHDVEIHGRQYRVHIDGVSGEVKGWGGSD